MTDHSWRTLRSFDAARMSRPALDGLSTSPSSCHINHLAEHCPFSYGFKYWMADERPRRVREITASLLIKMFMHEGGRDDASCN